MITYNNKYIRTLASASVFFFTTTQLHTSEPEKAHRFYAQLPSSINWYVKGCPYGKIAEDPKGNKSFQFNPSANQKHHTQQKRRAVIGSALALLSFGLTLRSGELTPQSRWGLGCLLCGTAFLWATLGELRNAWYFKSLKEKATKIAGTDSYQISIPDSEAQKISYSQDESSGAVLLVNPLEHTQTQKPSASPPALPAPKNDAPSKVDAILDTTSQPDQQQLVSANNQGQLGHYSQFQTHTTQIDSILEQLKQKNAANGFVEQGTPLFRLLEERACTYTDGIPVYRDWTECLSQKNRDYDNCYELIIQLTRLLQSIPLQANPHVHLQALTQGIHVLRTIANWLPNEQFRMTLITGKMNTEQQLSQIRDFHDNAKSFRYQFKQAVISIYRTFDQYLIALNPTINTIKNDNSLATLAESLLAAIGGGGIAENGFYLANRLGYFDALQLNTQKISFDPLSKEELQIKGEAATNLITLPDLFSNPRALSAYLKYGHSAYFGFSSSGKLAEVSEDLPNRHQVTCEGYAYTSDHMRINWSSFTPSSADTGTPGAAESELKIDRELLCNVLGVKQNASPQEITKAYHRKSLLWHPDKCPNKKKNSEEYRDFEIRFQAVTAAYEALTKASVDISSFDNSIKSCWIKIAKANKAMAQQ